MYWWHIAAEAVREGRAQRFGFITTNSLRQIFNRRVLEPHLSDSKNPLSLVFAIPDHPWVDSTDGAAVRIAMTVCALGDAPGQLLQVTAEREADDDARGVELAGRRGKIYADLSIGANVAAATPLKANGGISSNGVMLAGAGFIVTPDEADRLGLGREQSLGEVIRTYRNGRDLAQSPRGVMVIDLYGHSVDELRERFPAVYQWVLERVKPERDQSRDKGFREKWWLHGRPRPEWRKCSAGLARFIATVETTKHRVFVFLDSATLPDHKLVNMALPDAACLGVLSSRIHVAWSWASGSRHGVGNDSVYNKTRCFETFPFPEATEAQTTRIRELAEAIDAHRKRQQAAFEGLTLTGIYNVLEKLRAGEALTAKEREIHEQGLVSLLAETHDALDREVFAAYGWQDLGEALVGRPGATTPLPDKTPEQAEAEEELLSRLVALNIRRAAEEARGHIRWLRPDYQAPEATQTSAALEAAEAATPETAAAPAAVTAWPKTMPEQVQAVRAQLALGPRTLETVAAAFKRKPARSVAQVLAALEVLGQAQRDGELWALRAG